jgi:hypothetical protein
MAISQGVLAAFQQQGIGYPNCFHQKNSLGNKALVPYPAGNPELETASSLVICESHHAIACSRIISYSDLF